MCGEVASGNPWVIETEENVRVAVCERLSRTVCAGLKAYAMCWFLLQASAVSAQVNPPIIPKRGEYPGVGMLDRDIPLCDQWFALSADGRTLFHQFTDTVNGKPTTVPRSPYPACEPSKVGYGVWDGTGFSDNSEEFKVVLTVIDSETVKWETFPPPAMSR